MLGNYVLRKGLNTQFTQITQLTQHTQANFCKLSLAEVENKRKRTGKYKNE